MTTPLHNIDVGEPPVLLQKSRGFGWVGWLAALVVIAGVLGLLWMNYDRLIEASSPKSASAQPATTEAEPTPTVADFQLLQQQTQQAWQSTGQTIEAQNAELKRLTDQVTALTARIDQMQQPTSQPLALPRPAEPLRPSVTAAPRAAAPIAPRKQPTAAPRPSSTISLGGAPLPGSPPPATR